MSNRLRLDFSLEFNDERAKFLEKYLANEIFQQSPPSAEELEMMGNYVLWGKDRKTGRNVQQDKTVVINTKNGDWDWDKTPESLEALMESPSWSETQIATPERPPLKVKKEIFSRKEALEQCPDYLVETFVELFKQIDATDLKVELYELAHGRRVKPIRPALLEKFSEEEVAAATEQISHWTQYIYLKQRHQLIELRRQQYTLRDSFSNVVISSATPSVVEARPPRDFGDEIEVLPLGLMGQSRAANLIFRDLSRLNPTEYDEEKLKEISDLYWKKKSYAPIPSQLWIDFREVEHVYEIFQHFYELEQSGECIDDAVYGKNTAALLNTLKYYIGIANLNNLQQDILQYKLEKVNNNDIAAAINKKYKKTYNANYISTIFRQRIIPKINEAAAYHEQVVSNLFFPEEFKMCKDCGQWFLKDGRNFTRKSRSIDGFTIRCKKCEKIKRKGGSYNEYE